MVVEKVFAVIAESTRRDILEALVQESKAVGQLVDELGVSQPTVSKHLRVLREAGVVTMRAQGQKRFYAINTAPLAMVSIWLESLGAGIANDGARPAKAPAATVVEPVAAPERKHAAVPQRAAAPADVPGSGAAKNAESAAAGPAGAAAARPVRAPGVPARGTVPAATPELVPASGTTAEKAAETRPAPAHPADARQAAVRTGAQGPVRGAGTTATHGAASVPDKAVRGPQPVLATATDVDTAVQGPLSRSVGRAAKKGAGLLASFKRKKD